MWDPLQELKAELTEEGAAIASIAEEKGIDVSAVTSVVEEAITAQIDEALAAGTLTEEQAAAQKEKATDPHVAGRFYLFTC
ncbi:hypothetical protein [Marinicrinis lubricantis]|uniref:Uncharacterized protein n=1 Tax=Marinicrinis lubricantis TaxID=2086470 RepID=A0ABW1IR48_9BACL